MVARVQACLNVNLYHTAVLRAVHRSYNQDVEGGEKRRFLPERWR